MKKLHIRKIPKKVPKKVENCKVRASPGFEPTPTEAISMRSYAYSTAADTEHPLQSGSCLTMEIRWRSSIYIQMDLWPDFTCGIRVIRVNRNFYLPKIIWIIVHIFIHKKMIFISYYVFENMKKILHIFWRKCFIYLYEETLFCNMNKTSYLYEVKTWRNIKLSWISW